MVSKWRERLRHTLGFRLALWYAVVFVASSLAIVGLTYVLLAASLRQYDRETIQNTLARFATAYARGGGVALNREIRGRERAMTSEDFDALVLERARLNREIAMRFPEELLKRSIRRGDVDAR